MLREPESPALAKYLAQGPYRLATSGVAVVEVERGAWVGSGGDLEARAEARAVVESCWLIDVGPALLRAAARLASDTLRTLDAIHLASAQLVQPDEVLAYDARLRRAAADAGLTVIAPGLAA